MKLKTYCPKSQYGHGIHDIIYKVVNEEEILNNIGTEYMVDIKTINKSIKKAVPPKQRDYNRPLDPTILTFNKKHKKEYKQKSLFNFRFLNPLTL